MVRSAGVHNSCTCLDGIMISGNLLNSVELDYIKTVFQTIINDLTNVYQPTQVDHL